MKKLPLRWMLTMAMGLGGKGLALVDAAAAVNADSAAHDGRAYYKSGTPNRINAIADHSLGRQQTLLRADRLSEVEAKRLKLILLLVMSLGPYPTALRS